MGVSVDLFLFSILFSLLLALLVSMLMVWVWTLGRIWSGRPLLADVPCFPLREAPWGAMTVFSVIVLYLLVNVSVSRIYAAATGRKPMGSAEARKDAGIPPVGLSEAKDNGDPPDRDATESVKPGGAEPGKGNRGNQDQPETQTQTDILLQLAVINGLLVVLVPALMRSTAGARLADFGLTLVDWKRQMAVGGAAALLMTPAVYAIQSLAVRVWKSQQHPVEEMVLGKLSLGIALLAIVSTVVLAPMIEELLFRGIVQQWLTKLTGQRTTPAKPMRAEIPVELGADDFPPFRDPGDVPSGLSREEQRGSTSTDDRPRGASSAAGLPIVLTSITFASLHATQWPAPLAIFLLSMALGTLYHRTGSLLSVIAMHATFNGFSTLLLLLEALSRQAQAHAEKL